MRIVLDQYKTNDFHAYNSSFTRCLYKKRWFLMRNVRREVLMNGWDEYTGTWFIKNTNGKYVIVKPEMPLFVEFLKERERLLNIIFTSIDVLDEKQTKERNDHRNGILKENEYKMTARHRREQLELWKTPIEQRKLTND